MSTNLINKGINTTYGYLRAETGSETIITSLNENQDFFTTNYVLLKSGTAIKVESYTYNEQSRITNEIAIHVYNMNKQWLKCVNKTIYTQKLVVEYQAESDCYVRISMRGYRDFSHRAYIYLADYSSRLEKFIYAICSMEVSDLPAPLSQIEILWNCLITGGTPDFEPLSRNEKYLMAMLDRYDISNLPAPMSRGEKLLYKIAMGETDLSDVPGYLSRYEELLKYLIENGGISKGDFEYVLYTLNQSLYTLYNTAEKPVKSAILKGQTLVNLAIEKGAEFTEANQWKHLRLNQSLLNSSKKYLVSFDSSQDYNGYVHLRDVPTNTYITNATPILFKQGNNKILITNFLQTELNTFADIRVTFHLNNGSVVTPTISNVILLEYVEGMENWDIPYFEGMQSVKMPVLTTSQYPTKPIQDGLVCWLEASDIKNGDLMWKDKTNNNNNATLTGFTGDCFVDGCLKMKKGAKISLPTQLQYSTVQCVFAEDKINNYQIDIIGTTPITMRFCMRSGDYYPYYTNIKDIAFNNTDSVLESEKAIVHYVPNNMTKNSDSIFLHLECSLDNELHQNTTIGCDTNSGAETKFKTILIYNRRLTKEERLHNYEYAHGIELGNKSNILSVNKDVTLRGVGNGGHRVEDVLDLKTGELISSIGEVLLDGTQKKLVFQNWGSYAKTRFELIGAKEATIGYEDAPLLSDKLKPYGYWGEVDKGEYFFTTNNAIDIVHSRDKDIVQWLNDNPTLIVYPLLESTVKTVDLTTVNQDNQPAQLGTFENVTHVSLEAENLIPTVEMEVATCISTELASASPLMDDISTKQEQLNTTVDEQSENVDATMIATTEIFEETL